MPVSSPYAVFRAADLGWTSAWVTPPPRSLPRSMPVEAMVQGELFALLPPRRPTQPEKRLRRSNLPMVT